MLFALSRLYQLIAYLFHFKEVQSALCTEESHGAMSSIKQLGMARKRRYNLCRRC